MCLHDVIDTFPNPSARKRVAYKVFLKGRQGAVRFPFYTQKGTYVAFYLCNPTVPQNKWLTARNNNWNYCYPYPYGFHVCKTRKDAHRYLISGCQWHDQADLEIRKVYVRRIVATGKQNNAECLVARELYIPSAKTVPSRSKRPKRSQKST